MLCAELSATMSVQGSVFGHEEQVVQHMTVQLGKSDVNLKYTARPIKQTCSSSSIESSSGYLAMRLKEFWRL